MIGFFFPVQGGKQSTVGPAGPVFPHRAQDQKISQWRTDQRQQEPPDEKCGDQFPSDLRQRLETLFPGFPNICIGNVAADQPVADKALYGINEKNSDLVGQ